jgi:hypothetical protein
MRDDDDFTLGALRLDTSFTPNLGQWYNWRLEFEQRAQLSYDLLIDGQNVMARTTNRQSLPFNVIGAYKRGIPGTLWSDVNMRNVKWFTGDAPSTDVELDMPLFENALDLGPNENHGTTFNMELPSI